jgi:hypothetical protein
MVPVQQLSLPEQVASQAELIVNSVQQTDYQFTDNIDVDRGIYDCDCNGFASLVLKRAAPGHYALLPKETDQERPRAFEYYVLFTSLNPDKPNGWRRIDFLRDADRGDMIAWRYQDVKKHHATGHVMIVAETPRADDSGTFSVRVYDSAHQAHLDDTRGNGERQSKTGVGSGVIKFKVDDEGRPAAFQFSPSDHFETFPIAIGRLEALPPESNS